MKSKIQRVWSYLQEQQSEAFDAKNEIDFDWYGDATQAYFCILEDRPIKLTPRVKPLQPSTYLAEKPEASVA